MVNRSSATLSGIGCDIVAPAELPIPVISSVFRIIGGGRIVASRRRACWGLEWGVLCVVPYREVADRQTGNETGCSTYRLGFWHGKD